MSIDSHDGITFIRWHKAEQEADGKDSCIMIDPDNTGQIRELGIIALMGAHSY